MFWIWKYQKIDQNFYRLQKIENFHNVKKILFHQIRWTEFFSKFNIIIQFQFEIQNIKTNILIRIFDFRFKNEINEQHQYRKQILFISKRFEIHAIKFDKFIYERILIINKIDDNCTIYREIIEQNFTLINEIDLRNCNEKNDVLYRNDWL